MVRMLVLPLLVLALGACAHRDRAPGGVIVDMKGVDPARYQADLTECRQYANQVPVGGKAAGGVVGGAVVGGVLGAVVGDSDSAKRGAGAGAVVGGTKGTVRGIEERRQVVRNCLRNRGYAVLN